MNTTQQYTTSYWSAGFSLVPISLDGLRRPLVPWKRYQTERPTLEQVQDWFATPAGIGLVMGAVSGGAECIDFDDATTFVPVYDMLPDELQSRLAVYETPKGFHLIYRCMEVCGGRVIAKRKDGSIRIESRGEGCMITAEGSPFAVHKSGIPYCHYIGRRLEDLGTISPDERKMVWRICATHDQSGEPTPSQKLGRQLAEREYRERHPADPASIPKARAYLAKMEPAIQGADGSKALFRAACKLVGDFHLDPQDASQLLIAAYNPRCTPPWSEREIEHKVADAMRKVGR